MHLKILFNFTISFTEKYVSSFSGENYLPFRNYLILECYDKIYIGLFRFIEHESTKNF